MPHSEIPQSVIIEPMDETIPLTRFCSDVNFAVKTFAASVAYTGDT